MPPHMPYSVCAHGNTGSYPHTHSPQPTLSSRKVRGVSLPKYPTVSQDCSWSSEMALYIQTTQPY